MQSLDFLIEQNQSPDLVFNSDSIRKRAESLKRFCFNNDIELYFAVKACSESQILSLIAPYVDGFDVSNRNELKAIQSFEKPISLYDPTGQTPALENTVCISERPEHLKLNPSKMIRFNATELFPSKTPSRFGFSIQEFAEAKSIFGVHVHLRELHEYSLLDFQSIVRFILQTHPQVSLLNLGGGWHKLEVNNDYQRILQTLRRENPDLRLRIEPGRFFTWKCGKIRGRIVSVNRHRYEITTNISSYLHLNWCEPLLELEKVGTQIEVQIFGPTCYEFDKIGKFSVSQQWWERVQRGDQICFTGISSYTLQRQGEFNGCRKVLLTIE